MEINLISDTVTTPTKGMLAAMMSAKVGDDVFKEDATVNALEEKTAALFGMEAALFFPSGTMANQTAIKVHTQPGEQLICDHYAHIFNYEGGGVSFNSGVSCKLIAGHRGMITAKQVKATINPPDFYHSPLTTLVCLENTTNKGGGAIWDINEMKAIKEVCTSNGLKFHLDGARIWNALAVTGEDPKLYGNLFDSISVCLSKGLGCPVGSVLLGSKDFIAKALRVRKVFGGGMRQAGFLAAAGIYALDHHRERLKEDHKKAKEIEAILSKKDFISSVSPVDTNIIIFELKESVLDAQAFMDKMNENNIRLISMGSGKLRLVTHLNYTDEMHSRLLSILNGF
ncbi:MAG: threonine aldolase [Flavobacteriaceae bacterium]|jgi:threonine aldolase|nr:MAG: threonine aldolase [Polaribacter sp. BACL8 MAG-120531-bin13]KRP14593.1 MAG: threonine aldolase [Polaribacter sp. BACL8 MAG-120419-bin8]MCO4778775.1 threonine aldolase [Flavobacteriaceae bacterium]MDA9280499.1 beta-eliminating lyase-related protein [Flavobacteriaceae bacterium]MDA9887778.1 beta-eliminating lyase-related protein [Flavobacteriaceae bacterium]|tara:strand:+ start:349 stop:1371 length:1023 start_codon:yes stop_codon:yes gene_type:complete